MNREALRRERRRINRENHRQNRRHRLYIGGPIAVMDDPTWEHVKELLMKWVRPMALPKQTLERKHPLSFLERMGHDILQLVLPEAEDERLDSLVRERGFRTFDSILAQLAHSRRSEDNS